MKYSIKGAHVLCNNNKRKKRYGWKITQKGTNDVKDGMWISPSVLWILIGSAARSMISR
jgi:hypothetical protein